jgi:hypothetical protein
MLILVGFQSLCRMGCIDRLADRFVSSESDVHGRMATALTAQAHSTCRTESIAFPFSSLSIQMAHDRNEPLRQSASMIVRNRQ